MTTIGLGQLVPRMTTMSLLVQRLSEDARLPTRGSEHAAGYDLYASKDYIIEAGGKGMVPLDIAVAIPEGHYGRVAPRSSLASKHAIDVGAGVVDCDYRGPMFVVLFNLGSKAYSIAKGDRIAQMIIEKIAVPEVKEVSVLPDTTRGCGGFGSTGK